MDATRLNAILSEFRRGAESIYGPRLERIVLFGSQARNEARPDSDIDVMVVLQGAINPHVEGRLLSEFRAELCLKFDAVISCVFVSEEKYRQDGAPLLLNVRREGVRV